MRTIVSSAYGTLVTSSLVEFYACDDDERITLVSQVYGPRIPVYRPIGRALRRVQLGSGYARVADR